MPKLTTAEAPNQTGVEFVFSESLDLLNAMYFTRLVVDSEGVDGWPVELRKEMDPELLAELDLLYTFPNGQPGVMGELGDVMFAHPEVWGSVGDLLKYVRNMPLGVGNTEKEAGVQGLAFYLACIDAGELRPAMDPNPREALREKLQADGVEDVEGALAIWDNPAELRDRMVNLIERFYNEHYKAQLPERRACLERSVAAHRGASRDEAIVAMQRALNRPRACLEDVCPLPYEKLIFVPSLDMGPYASCADIDGHTHGMFYPCEAEFIREGEPHANEIVQMARMYKALSDEQRLKILHLLREREMYAQEIVDRMGLHQSVVSRHLSFMRAVGLVSIRKQNNMKFYSLNPIAGELTRIPGLYETVRKEARDEFLRP